MWVGNLIANILRLFHVAMVLTGFAVVQGLGSLRRRVLRRGAVDPAVGPVRVRKLLERLGGSFIKFGQVLALQPDLIPRSYCDAFFDLLDRVPPFDYQGVERVFREDLGRFPEEVFDAFEREPFAAASIGQVHVAWLDGRKLAVKVQRPTAQRDFGGDIRLMRGVIWLITALGLKRFYAIRQPISEFVAWTREELDYLIEARYMERLAVNSRDRSEERVPEVIPEISTSRLLVAEYLEGIQLLDYMRGLESGDRAVLDRAEEMGFDAHEFARNILENFLGDVFRHGVFHADLHPANLLILPGDTVGYVDFGISGVISEYSRRHVLEMILALIRHDIDGLCDGIVSIAEVRKDSEVEKFREEMKRSSEQWFEGHGDSLRARKSYTLMMLDMLRICRNTNVMPHVETLRYLRSVITVEGLISRFAPTYDVNRALERATARHLESLAYSSIFSAANLLDSLAAGGRLLRDGARRFDRMFDRIERKGLQRTNRWSRAGRTGRTKLARRALRLASLIAVVALVMGTGSEPVSLGLNRFTSELVVMGSGFVFLARTVMQWLIEAR